MYFEHYANMFQENLILNKTFLFGSIYSNRHRNPTLPLQMRNKCSVKHIHINRNITLNIEHFQLGLIAVLSGRCHFYDVV